MRARPINPAGLVAELSSRIVAATGRIGHGGWPRVAVDGAPAAEPERLADNLVTPLRVAGRPVVRIRAEDFLRPASLRLEYGRHNPDTYYQGWRDEAGLRREVLDPAGDGGSGRVLPSLWNASTDRASRAEYVTLVPGTILIVSGSLLLGGSLPFDLTVHLLMSPAALRRRTSGPRHWTLPAFDRYAAEVRPESFADVVIKVDHPQHPVLLQLAG